jgi:hypothetical protein
MLDRHVETHIHTTDREKPKQKRNENYIHTVDKRELKNARKL